MQKKSVKGLISFSSCLSLVPCLPVTIYYKTGYLLTDQLPYFSIDNAHVIYTKKRSKFVKNEHARYTLGMKKGKNLERLITATSQARF